MIWLSTLWARFLCHHPDRVSINSTFEYCFVCKGLFQQRQGVRLFVARFSSFHEAYTQVTQKGDTDV